MAEQAPMLEAWTVEKREGKDDWWTRIGAAFPTKDGKGYSLVLQALPLNGRIVLLPPKPKPPS